MYSKTDKCSKEVSVIEKKKFEVCGTKRTTTKRNKLSRINEPTARYIVLTIAQTQQLLHTQNHWLVSLPRGGGVGKNRNHWFKEQQLHFDSHSDVCADLSLVGCWTRSLCGAAQSLSPPPRVRHHDYIALSGENLLRLLLCIENVPWRVSPLKLLGSCLPCQKLGAREGFEAPNRNLSGRSLFEDFNHLATICQTQKGPGYQKSVLQWAQKEKQGNRRNGYQECHSHVGKVQMQEQENCITVSNIYNRPHSAPRTFSLMY